MRAWNFSIGLLAIICLTSLTSCNWNDNQLNGYVEGQLTYISSPTDGRLDQLTVGRGMQVKKGDLLYSLESLPESAELNSATAIINQANANLKDLLYGKRPPEIEAIESQIREVKARIAYLSKEQQRYKILVEKSAVERERYDQTVQDLDVANAQLKQMQANLSTAKLPARTDEIKAAEATLTSTQAQFDKANWALKEKTVYAPDNAEVFDTYYKIGERIPGNRPVLSLLVPRDIIAVFFVPETQLANIHVNQKIAINCDSCKTPYEGIIRFISPQAEYTPPVIYSNTARSKLVYRVEANILFENKPLPHPGQPIDISLQRNGK